MEDPCPCHTEGEETCSRAPQCCQQHHKKIWQDATEAKITMNSCRARLRLYLSLSSNRPRSLSAKRSLERLLERLLISLSLLLLRLILALQLIWLKLQSYNACCVSITSYLDLDLDLSLDRERDLDLTGDLDFDKDLLLALCNQSRGRQSIV